MLEQPNTCQEVKSREIRPNNGVGRADNPSQPTMSLHILRLMNDDRQAFANKYGIKRLAYDLLLKVCDRHDMEGVGSTIYWLSGGSRNYMGMIGLSVRLLHSKGLLEVLGNSRGNAPLYIPSKLAIAELGLIINHYDKHVLQGDIIGK